MQVNFEKRVWLRGNGISCPTKPKFGRRPLRAVLLGPPGVGKGTQAALLFRGVGACHLSTGEILRSARRMDPRDRTPCLNAALEYMRRGELVPDQTVVQLIQERTECLHCNAGFLLDGFPRTVEQAKALEDILASEHVSLDAAISYEMPLEKIVERLSGRRSCSSCKALYHVKTMPPANKDACDHCGNQLCQREDDRPEFVRVRIGVYLKNTAPLLRFYEDRGLLIQISADGSPEEIYKSTVDQIRHMKVSS